MKRLLFVLVIALAVLAAPTSAQFIGRTVTVANLGACQNLNAMAYVTDATNATTLGAGGGSAGVFVNCNSGSWAIDEVAAVSDLSAYLPVSGTTAAPIVIQNSGAGNDGSFIVIDDMILTGTDFLPTFSATAVLVAPAQTYTATTSWTVTSPVQLQTATTSSTVTSPVQVNTASTSILNTTPKFSVSGNYEYKVTSVTVADDAAGTKPAGVIPITTDIALGICNDATGSTLTITEPTVTSGGRRLTLISTVTGNCELADSAGVLELSGAAVLEPNSTLSLVYANAAWHEVARVDNVP